MNQETMYVPLEFWCTTSAGLALPWCIMPDPATGEMTFYNAMHGTAEPLRQVLEQEHSLGDAKL